LRRTSNNWIVAPQGARVTVLLATASRPSISARDTGHANMGRRRAHPGAQVLAPITVADPNRAAERGKHCRKRVADTWFQLNRADCLSLDVAVSAHVVQGGTTAVSAKSLTPKFCAKIGLWTKCVLRIKWPQYRATMLVNGSRSKEWHHGHHIRDDVPTLMQKNCRYPFFCAKIGLWTKCRCAEFCAKSR
jgi:hypothetical protein